MNRIPSTQGTDRTRPFRTVLLLGMVVFAAGSAINPCQSAPPDLASVVERGVTQTQGPLSVTAAVPDAAETKALCGLDLYDQGIQPVWLKVENRGDKPARAAIWSIDPDYYSPLEVAYMNRAGLNKQEKAAMERWFHDNQLARQIPPGEARSGFVYTHRSAGIKGFNLDVYTNDDDYHFTFFVPVPGFTADYMEVDFAGLYAAEEMRALDADGLRNALNDMPCCSTDASGTGIGDPINVVLVGTGLAVRRALLRAGWDETAAGGAETASARQHRYRGRPPDGTFRNQARPNGSQSKELRLWLTPMTLGEDRVFVGQVSYEMSGASGAAAADYRVDPDIDEARVNLLQGFWYGQSLQRISHAKGVGASTIEAPRESFAGLEYFTDGRRAVMWLSEEPVAMNEARQVIWELSPDAPGSTADPEATMRKRRQVPPPNDRLTTTTVGDVRVTVAVPSAAETKEIFGVKLYTKNIQPVWVKLENLSDRYLSFLPFGLDSAYFTPLETAYRNHAKRSKKNESLNRTFHDSAMGMDVAPGSVRSGYVFTTLDEGTKSFNVDVVDESEQLEPYRTTFFVEVPGLRLDHYEVDFEDLYGEDDFRDVDLAGLAAGLEAMPCCVTGKNGKTFGDPLNVALVGEIEDVYYAFVRAGWDETETISAKSLMKMGKSAIAGSEYRYSPVSALYVFGRAQDVAFQRARTSINERNHLRLWVTPMRFEGKPVWIGQISRDIGVHFTAKTITTHKIDPAVDETREFLVEDLAYAQSLAKFGYVTGVGEASFDSPRGNLTGDPYFTDGRRIVLWIPDQVHDIADIEVVDLRAQ